MKQKWIAAIAIAVSTALVSTPAWAGACKPRDLVGAYQMYVNSVGLGGKGWVECTLLIREDGSVRPNTRCTNSIGAGATITGGFLSVVNACLVTGEIDVSTGGTSIIDHAFFDLSRNLIIGVGHDIGGPNISFRAVRK